MKKYQISFVLPMFNESENIETTIGRLSDFAASISDDYEIVVVDDGSTDNCAAIVDKLAGKDSHVKSIRLKENTRFGGALKEGLKNARKEIVLYTDSDLPAKEEDMRKTLELLEGADIVTAYSLVTKDASLKRIVMSKAYNFLVRSLFGLHVRDANSGLKIYRRSALEGIDLRSKSPFIDVEIFVEAIKRKRVIRQYGLVFDLRTKGKSSISRLDIVTRTFWDMLAYWWLEIFCP